MIGWYVALAFAALAMVFFLVYLYEHGEHKETSRLWREAETAWDNERKQFMDLVKKHVAKCDGLQLQLEEALKPKPRRGGTKKEKAQP